MISKSLPEVDHFVPVQPTKHELDYADLDTLDFSRYDEGPEARKELAAQLHQAMTTHGFFVVVNHGLSEEQITRQVDIGHTILKRTPPEEKIRLKADILGKGEYPGFKPRGHWKAGDKPDRIENFNVNRNMNLHEQPAALEPYRQEIQDVVDLIHKDILYKVLRLFAIALEIEDEEFFVKLFSYENHDESWARWMQYYDDGDQGGQSLWLGGHQDLSALSLLFSQPMASLQVRDYEDDAQWRYVRHIPGAIIVNAGEPMKWWTGDHFKAAVHRVVQPPADQRGHDRSGFFYFTVPNDNVVINTLLEESPVLRRAGVQKWFKEGEAPTSKEWCNNRIRVTGQKALFQNKNADQNKEVEKIGTVETTWYR
jgi:isopenicillin N synthase-like dioxygenase